MQVRTSEMLIQLDFPEQDAASVFWVSPQTVKLNNQATPSVFDCGCQRQVHLSLALDCKLRINLGGRWTVVLSGHTSSIDNCVQWAEFLTYAEIGPHRVNSEPVFGRLHIKSPEFHNTSAGGHFRLCR